MASGPVLQSMVRDFFPLRTRARHSGPVQSDSESEAGRRACRTRSSAICCNASQMNEQHLESRNQRFRTGCANASYELAFRMQMSAPEATDVSSESEATKKLYGLDDPDKAPISVADVCWRGDWSSAAFVSFRSGPATA